MQFAFEDSGLALQLFRVVILGEGDVDVEGFAGLVADNLVFKAGDELARAEGQMEMLRLAAFKGLVVDKAFKVDVDDIAVFSAAVLNSDGAGVAVAASARFRRRPLRRVTGSTFLEALMPL